MKSIFLILILINLSFAVEINVDEISVDEVFKIKDDVVLIDVREPSEFKAGRIDGSIFIPLRDLEEGIEIYTPDMSEEIIIYCLAGPRSIKAVKTLKELGYENVKYMKGGIKSWIKNKLPISR